MNIQSFIRKLIKLKPNKDPNDYQRFSSSGLELPEDIREETDKEFRERIANSMATPIRCGGFDYVDGKRVYRIQGYLVPVEVVDQGWEAIKEWQSKNEPYVK